MDLTIVLLIAIFLAGLIIAYYIGHKTGILKRDKHWESQVDMHRKDAVARSRAVLGGQFSEQIAPYLPNFPFSPTEVRFLGKPIDFIAFKGMDNKKIDEVVFVEVKSGKSNLNNSEKSLKETIEKKKVKWMEYSISEDLTKNNLDLEK